jgi:hypothetical protein
MARVEMHAAPSAQQVSELHAAAMAATREAGEIVHLPLRAGYLNLQRIGSDTVRIAAVSSSDRKLWEVEAVPGAARVVEVRGMSVPSESPYFPTNPAKLIGVLTASASDQASGEVASQQLHAADPVSGLTPPGAPQRLESVGEAWTLLTQLAGAEGKWSWTSRQEQKTIRVERREREERLIFA